MPVCMFRAKLIASRLFRLPESKPGTAYAYKPQRGGRWLIRSLLWRTHLATP